MVENAAAPAPIGRGSAERGHPPPDRGHRLPGPGRLRAPAAGLPGHPDRSAGAIPDRRDGARAGRVPAAEARVHGPARAVRRGRAAGPPGRTHGRRGRRLQPGRARHPGRDRCRHPLRRHGELRSAGRRRVPDEPARRDEPVPRGAGRGLTSGVRAHLDGLRRRRAEGRDPGGTAGAPGGLPARVRAGARSARRRRGDEPPAGAAGVVHGEGGEGALPRRSADRGG